MILNVDANALSKLTIKQTQEVYANLIVKLLKIKSAKLILQFQASFDFVKAIS